MRLLVMLGLGFAWVLEPEIPLDDVTHLHVYEIHRYYNGHVAHAVSGEFWNKSLMSCTTHERFISKCTAHSMSGVHGIDHEISQDRS